PVVPVSTGVDRDGARIAEAPVCDREIRENRLRVGPRGNRDARVSGRGGAGSRGCEAISSALGDDLREREAWSEDAAPSSASTGSAQNAAAGGNRIAAASASRVYRSREGRALVEERDRAAASATAAPVVDRKEPA